MEENNQLAISKNTFSENIKEWVQLDKQIKLANEKMAKLREKRTSLLMDICHYKKTQYQSLNKITISDGELCFYEKKEYSPLTYRYLEDKLKEIIPDKTQVEYIIDYLKENREVKTVSDIRRIEKNPM
jgi:Zn/Cd-binding protein ZinT